VNLRPLHLALPIDVIEPQVRFRAPPGGQAAMFFRDPAGNGIQMKVFADLAMLFAKD